MTIMIQVDKFLLWNLTKREIFRETTAINYSNIRINDNNFIRNEKDE